MNLQKTINTQKYMNYKRWIIGLCILNILPALSQEYNIENIHIDGYIGNRINTCIEHRVKSQNTDHLIEPFKHRNEDHLWQSEFFGKWAARTGFCLQGGRGGRMSFSRVGKGLYIPGTYFND